MRLWSSDQIRYSTVPLLRPDSTAGAPLLPGLVTGLRGPTHEGQHLSKQSLYVGILLSLNIYSELDVQFQISGRHHLTTKWASQPGSSKRGPWRWDTMGQNVIWFLFDARHLLSFVPHVWSHNVQDLQRDGAMTPGPGHERMSLGGAHWEHCHTARPVTTISRNLIFHSQIWSQIIYKFQSKTQQQQQEHRQ